MIAGRKVLAIVPARGGSKGVPRKNLRIVGGKSLLAWTVQAAQAARTVDRVILTSDDDEIIAAARALGCDAPFKRPEELARDETPGIEPVLHALSLVPGFDIAVLLQPTSPLRTAADIDACIEKLVAAGARACVSLAPAECHPYLTFRMAADAILESFVSDRAVANMLRQDFPDAWRLNGAVYAADVRWLIQSKTFIGPATIGYAMPAQSSLDIDTEEDLLRADAVLTESSVHIPERTYS